MIPLLDVAAGHAELADEIEAAIARVLRSGIHVGGSEVGDFEAEWATYTEARHCVGVGSGLDALTLALRALGVGPGDEVIVPGHTFIATWLAVTAVGAIPVPTDPPEGGHLIDVAGVERVMSARTTAVIPVHLYGDPVDLDPILALARRHEVAVVEDAAQAHGARYRGRRIGAHGHVAAWSFYPSKNLGAAGDAGAITTDDPEIARRVRVLANYGSEAKHAHPSQGVNSRLDPVQAAVLRVKLRRLDAWNGRRSRLARIYREGLPARALLAEASGWAEPVHHVMVVAVEDRDGVRQRLAADGIETGIHYPTPVHRQGAFSELARASSWSLPQTERLAEHVLSLPLGPHLPDEAAHAVIERLRSIVD